MKPTTFEEPKLHSGHMEVAVSVLINPRVSCIVPNVSWGLGLSHECDMLALDDKNRFTEIEIKISASDLKADMKKDKHKRVQKIISRLVYAVPEKLVPLAVDICPSGSGIIGVKWLAHVGVHEAYWHRQSKHNKYIQAPNEATMKKFMTLGCMRIWTLKRALHRKNLKTVL